MIDMNIVYVAGVPVVPGSPGPIINVQEAQRFCEKHGFPVILKAARGGGGRGMRKVTSMAVSVLIWHVLCTFCITNSSIYQKFACKIYVVVKYP
jgi:hypothetical protein